MMLSARNALLMLCLSMAGTPALALDPVAYQASAQQMLQQLSAQTGNARNGAVLAINSRASLGELSRATGVLEGIMESHPQDRVARMYYGYGQLFMASEFLKNKNYFRAAELSKRGFFFIDEAAESDENDWRMRFLRARMDAFVPAVNGRCVVALKDITFLRTQQEVPAELHPFIALMEGRALSTCQRGEQAEAVWQQLQQAGEQGEWLLSFKTGEITPFLTPEEIRTVLQPLLGAPS